LGIGILLAAKVIADVRREWTGLPGIAGRMRGHWNRLLKHIPGLVRILQSAAFHQKSNGDLAHCLENTSFPARPRQLGNPGVER